jgi:hypothetical protein
MATNSDSWKANLKRWTLLLGVLQITVEKKGSRKRGRKRG